jgi:hypothetical protein
MQTPYGYGPYAAPTAPMTKDDSSAATTVFVYGILGFVLCQIFAPLAWIRGNEYLRTCRALGVQPSGLGVAGRVLGIVGTVMTALSIVVLIVGLLGSSLAN